MFCLGSPITLPTKRPLSVPPVAGACTASFYGWLPLYLPELFPTNTRYTGSGIAYNVSSILGAALTPFEVLNSSQRRTANPPRPRGR